MIAIYDRNILDVQTAKELLTKIYTTKFSSLTVDEKAMWLAGLKGCLNYTDVNRIESNCKEISDLIGLGLTTKTTWVNGEFIKVSDFERIINNVILIRNTNYIRSDTPQTPGLPLNRYDKINDIEKILINVFDVYTANSVAIDYMDNEIYIDENIGVM